MSTDTITTYEDLYDSQFPYAVAKFDRKIDIDLSLKPIVDKYYEFIAAGRFDEVDNLIKENPRIKQTIWTAQDQNQLRDEIIAVQRYFISDVENKILKLSISRGTWDRNTKYFKYNVVVYTENHVTQSYVAIPKSDTDFDIPIGTLPTDTNYWHCITLRGEKGEPGLGLSPQGPFSLGIQYHKDDLVSHNNCLWYALIDNIDQVPNEKSTSWQLLMKFTGDLLMFDNSTTNLNSTTLQNAIIEVNNKIRSIKNVTIPAGGFINGIYTYRNSIITSYYAPHVFYDSSSKQIARKCDIEVKTFEGYMTFTALRKIPTVALQIEAIQLIEV